MDKITINKSDGTTEEFEIVMIFNLEKYNGDYIIYKDNEKFYSAKYVEMELITELSQEEKEDILKIFNEIGGNL